MINMEMGALVEAVVLTCSLLAQLLFIHCYLFFSLSIVSRVAARGPFYELPLISVGSDVLCLL